MTPLRKGTIEYMHLRGYSDATITSYIGHLKHFALYYNRCPSQLGLEEVQVYLLYLIKEKNYTQSSVNGAYSAIKILFEKVLNNTYIHYDILSYIFFENYFFYFSRDIKIIL